MICVNELIPPLMFTWNFLIYLVIVCWILWVIISFINYVDPPKRKRKGMGRGMTLFVILGSILIGLVLAYLVVLPIIVMVLGL